MKHRYALGGFARRSADVVLSLSALILLAPCMLLITIAIKTTTIESVFLKHGSRGIGGRQINLLRFRAGDSTPLGSFLRRTHLDELPQLFNVLKGDLSFFA